MKSKDKKELHTEKAEELRKSLKEAQKVLLNARLDNKQNKLNNTRSIFHLRKQISVIKTVLQMKAKEVER